ncbi:TIGR01777 family oxidoreductase [Zavarzinella formosa]|uniref:TIGR01777 family oxidoreductase n=1 Tax=Zavarzinella formosa TaxID=360055 RepID=UPI0002DBCD26|nr:TIGR01777 family oxidoreductase [Zavarzinella formosa]
MKIVIPGGTGQIGQILTRAFVAAGHEVVILSRTVSPSAVRVVAWDAINSGEWEREIDGADVVVNLAGRSVNCRYSAANRRDIMESRVNSTRAIAKAMAGAVRPPKVWLQSSTATIYAHRYDTPNDETTGLIGGDEPNVPGTWRFSTDVAKAWESAASEIPLPRTRTVLMRTAMVMSPDRDGVFDVLAGLVRKRLGGTNGNGRQFVSWIHDHDFTRAALWLIDRDDLSGPVNLCSPNPLPNAEFMRILRQAAGIKIGLPATKWMLELGAIFLKTETELILKSRRVVPGRLMESGFRFEFPEWANATRDLWGRYLAGGKD